MRPIDTLVINPQAEDVQTAAAALAAEWEVPGDVAQLAVMLWQERMIGAMLRDPIQYSSAPIQAAAYWRAAVSAAQELKAQQLGPWLPREKATLSAALSHQTMPSYWPPTYVEDDTPESIATAADLLISSATLVGLPELEDLLVIALAARGIVGRLRCTPADAEGVRIYELDPPARLYTAPLSG